MGSFLALHTTTFKEQVAFYLSHMKWLHKNLLSKIYLLPNFKISILMKTKIQKFLKGKRYELMAIILSGTIILFSNESAWIFLLCFFGENTSPKEMYTFFILITLDQHLPQKSYDPMITKKFAKIKLLSINLVPQGLLLFKARDYCFYVGSYFFLSK